MSSTLDEPSDVVVGQRAECLQQLSSEQASLAENFGEAKTSSCEYIHKISPNVVLHIYRTNNYVAINFTDEMNNNINTPSGLIIYTKDFQTNTKVIQKPVDNNLYALCWSDDYIVEFNNELVLDVKNKPSTI